MTTGIYIGVSTKAVKRVTEAINDIPSSNVADAVQLAALDVLKTGCRIENATVSYNTVTMPSSEKKAKRGK